MKNNKIGKWIIAICFESWIIPLCVIFSILPKSFFEWLANDKGFKHTFNINYREWF